jgi:hypothetical protein
MHASHPVGTLMYQSARTNTPLAGPGKPGSGASPIGTDPPTPEGGPVDAEFKVVDKEPGEAKGG